MKDSTAATMFLAVFYFAAVTQCGLSQIASAISSASSRTVECRCR